MRRSLRLHRLVVMVDQRRSLRLSSSSPRQLRPSSMPPFSPSMADSRRKGRSHSGRRVESAIQIVIRRRTDHRIRHPPSSLRIAINFPPVIATDHSLLSRAVLLHPNMRPTDVGSYVFTSPRPSQSTRGDSTCSLRSASRRTNVAIDHALWPPHSMSNAAFQPARAAYRFGAARIRIINRQPRLLFRALLRSQLIEQMPAAMPYSRTASCNRVRSKLLYGR
jgi:hypothetical protein